MWFKNKDSFIPSSPIRIPSTFFSCLIVLARPPSTCWEGVVRADIPALNLTFAGNLVSYDVWHYLWAFVHALYQVKQVPSVPSLLRISILKGFEFCQMLGLLTRSWNFPFWSVIVMNYVRSFWILSQPCRFGIKCTWSWHILLLMLVWIWFTNVFCSFFLIKNLHLCSWVTLVCAFLFLWCGCLLLVSGWCWPHGVSQEVPPWLLPSETARRELVNFFLKHLVGFPMGSGALCSGRLLMIDPLVNSGRPTQWLTISHHSNWWLALIAVLLDTQTPAIHPLVHLQPFRVPTCHVGLCDDLFSNPQNFNF